MVFLNGYQLSPALDRIGRLEVRTVKVKGLCLEFFAATRMSASTLMQAASMATVVSNQLKGLVPLQTAPGSVPARRECVPS